MARVLALCGDLMFGSRIAAQLQGAGEALELLPDAAAVSARLQDPAQERPRVLVVDLTSGSEEGIELVGALVGEGQPRTLGFYSHVEADVRERAYRRRFRPGGTPLADGARGCGAGGAVLEDPPSPRTSG